MDTTTLVCTVWAAAMLPAAVSAALVGTLLHRRAVRAGTCLCDEHRVERAA